MPTTNLDQSEFNQLMPLTLPEFMTDGRWDDSRSRTTSAFKVKLIGKLHLFSNKASIPSIPMATQKQDLSSKEMPEYAKVDPEAIYGSADPTTSGSQRRKRRREDLESDAK
jgi:hypothetical protein